jgi:hypothetical protein
MKSILINILFLTPVMSFGQVTGSTSIPSSEFVAMLKPECDSMNAIINDSVIFVAFNGQLLLYDNYSHSAYIADGRSGYIPPEQIIRVDTPFFKFNFSKHQFYYDKEYELYESAQQTGADLNLLIQRIQNKEESALLQFFKLHNVVDGASAEEFSENFWALINLWTDKELLDFIRTLKVTEKKDFCTLLIESSYCNPDKYYKLYYPLTMKEIESTK